MTEINWNLFKAKFNGKEESIFENLAYQLFCNEHNLSLGIFRFKNQTGIETEPIQIENQYIGFQAKYYETKLSENKADIIDSIKKAKGKNPDLDKILLYVNREFSESSKKSKKDPRFKLDIEEAANNINVSIEWRVPSHFERQLVLPVNQYLTDYFFSLDNSVIDFIAGLKSHTENLLLSIQSDIKFNGQNIKIDRAQVNASLEKESDDSQIVIISGDGGCGKTAAIKDLYVKYKDKIPMYVFKAVEFNIQEINSLFRGYGHYSLNDFLESHSQEKNKIIVIDSAEKISDLENQEPLKEFISALQKDFWKIIFTTRLSYLDDLKFQFIEVYRLPFIQVNINNLTEDGLQVMSNEYSFKLPSNIRVRTLIQNPFYLDEFLKNYNSLDDTIDYNQFKDILWIKKIQKSSYTKNNAHILREKCFLTIIKARCETGLFFVNPKNCASETLDLLQKDEIISYEKSNGGYFITHDIYEEWGLQVLIERVYHSVIDYNAFLQKIGTTLIVRRAFRKWLSENLADSIANIRPFIEKIFSDEKIEPFWKDEALISILLSDYSSEFFNQFEGLIIKDDYTILKKIIFLLRIACKEVDNSLYKLLNKSGNVDLKYVLTQPKGMGWSCTIEMVYEKSDLFSIGDLHFLMPLLQDWCNKNKRGHATRKVGLFCLKLYTATQGNNQSKYILEKLEKQLIKIIIQSASEAKNELINIFNAVIENNWIKSNDPYYDLCITLLESDVDNIPVWGSLPEYVLRLADFYWYEHNFKNRINDYGDMGVERYYSLSSNVHQDYFPASAYQTPIYWLLKFALKDTMDFILSFTNKTVDSYAISGLESNVGEIKIITGDKQIQKQFISHCLWQMYRGTGSPVTPYLLQSIHMALEKHLLEIAKTEDSIVIESWLLYLIKKSTSASITSVISSVVLAFPDKFFNVGKILFSDPDVFHYDNMRVGSEFHAKSLYSIGRGMDYRTKIFEDERIKTCDDTHRKSSLESLILNYQFFNIGNLSDLEFKQRQEQIWSIVDGFYENLPDKENDGGKTRRLLLARIDRRKMNPTVEQQGENLLINFNPTIDPDLIKHSNEALQNSRNEIKYMSLGLWGTYKFDESEKARDYPQFETNPNLALKETREIVEGLKNDSLNSNFHLFNKSIPGFTCAAIIKSYSTELSFEDKEFCKDVILGYAVAPLDENYNYQISDGVEAAISAIPFLFDLFPEENNAFNLILLLLLFDNYPIGQYKRICDYSIEAILNNLWKISPKNAIKIFFGFLKFKPILNGVSESMSQNYSSYHSGYNTRYKQAMAEFLEKHQDELEFCLSNSTDATKPEIDKCSLGDLDTLFQLIPFDTNDQHLLKFITLILPVFGKQIFLDEDRNSGATDYALKHRFFKRYSYFILFREANDIDMYSLPFVDNFTNSRNMVSFFQQIVWAQDKVNRYEQFWIIWKSFYKKIVASAANSKVYYSNEIIHNYLLAWGNWKDTAKEWHSLKEREKLFYKRVVTDIGHCPSVLYSISKLLNDVGSPFIDDGVFWVSEMIEKLKTNELEDNTVYYIEILVRRYVHLNRNKTKQDIRIKNKILTILNFLIKYSSVNAYMLREDII